MFDERKVENNAIDYRLPIDSSNPDGQHAKVDLNEQETLMKRENLS